MIVPLYVTFITSRVNTLLLWTIIVPPLRTIPWRDLPLSFRIAFPTSLRTPFPVPIAWYLLFQFGTHVTFARLSSSLPFLTRVISERDARVFPSCFSTDLFTLDPVATPRSLLRTRAIVFDLVLAFRSLWFVIPHTIDKFFRSRSVAGKWLWSRQNNAICNLVKCRSFNALILRLFLLNYYAHI